MLMHNVGIRGRGAQWLSYSEEMSTKLKTWFLALNLEMDTAGNRCCGEGMGKKRRSFGWEAGKTAIWVGA